MGLSFWWLVASISPKAAAARVLSGKASPGGSSPCNHQDNEDGLLPVEDLPGTSICLRLTISTYSPKFVAKKSHFLSVLLCPF